MEKKYYRIRVTDGQNNNGFMVGFNEHEVFLSKGSAVEYMMVYGYGFGVKDFEIDEVNPSDMGTDFAPFFLTPPDKSEKTTEYCPHCESEVELDCEFTLQRCPECGRLIAPCNLCDHDLCDCANCPLSRLTSKLNY